MFYYYDRLQLVMALEWGICVRVKISYLYLCIMQMMVSYTHYAVLDSFLVLS